MARWLTTSFKPWLGLAAIGCLWPIGSLPSQAAVRYRLDNIGDGGANRLFPVGLEPRPDYTGQVVGDLLWLNRYTVETGGEILDSVSLIFGAAPRTGLTRSSGLTDWQTRNYPVTVLLYGDPNNDGDPIDAQLLTQSTGRLQNPDSLDFTTIDLAPTTLKAGQNFFVGALFRNLERNQRPASADLGPANSTNPPLGRSWFAIGNHGDGQPSNIDLNNLANNFAPNGGRSPVPLPTVYGNWVIRASGRSLRRNIPESGMVVGLGAIGVWWGYRQCRGQRRS
jgi:hypothetical protein